MKLPELKKIFRKKYIIKVVAGALVVGLVSTGTVQYTAMADKTEETEKTTENILDGSGLSIENKDLDKDETVYFIAKPDGTVDDTIVAAHLINKDGADTIDDVADVTDIENTNGDEKFTQNGSNVTWQADGNDIYYQGHSSQQAPVSVKVTYTLDGQEVSPDELAGKSGHVKIHYDYTNNTTFEEKVNGDKVSTVVPFTAITGMILNDDFTNVKVDNGRIIQNGTKTIVIGYALPGLKKSLEQAGGSFDSDLSLPDSMEVEADVKDFDLQTQMTAIVDASNFMTSNSEDTDDLSGDMDKLSDASGKLSDGGKQLKDGSTKVSDGAKSLRDGSKKLLNGSGDLEDGALKLRNGAQSLNNGIGTLKNSMGTFKDGTSTLTDGIKSYTDGVSQLNGGIGQLHDSLAPLKSKLPALLKQFDIDSLTSQLSQLSSGVKQLKDGSDQLLAGYNGDGTASNPGLVNSMDKLASGAKQVSDGAESLSANSKTLSDGVSKVSAGAAALDKGIGQIQSALSGVGTQFSSQSQAQLKATIDSKINGNSQMKALLGQVGVGEVTVSNVDSVASSLVASQTQIITALTKANGGDAAKATAAYYTALDGLHQVQAAKAALDAAGKSLQSQLSAAASDQTTQSQLQQLVSGAKQVSDGAKQLEQGAGALSNGAGSLASGAKSVSDGLSQANAGVKKLAAGQKQLSDGIDKFASATSSSKLDSIDTSEIKKLPDQLNALIDGVDKLYKGSQELDANSGRLISGSKELSDGSGKLSDGVDKLYDGSGDLYDGIGTLYDGTKTLNNGISSLYDGTVTLYKGTKDLESGATDLYEGIDRFNKEGIEKILNSYNGDIKPLANQLRAAIDAGEQYDSFSGLADGKTGAVKFLYRMDSITAPDDED